MTGSGAVLRIVWLWFIFLILLSSVASRGRCTANHAAPEPKSVLVGFPFDSHVMVQEETDQVFRRSMLKDSQPLQFFTEYLDLIRFLDHLHQEKLLECLRVQCGPKDELDCLFFVSGFAVLAPLRNSLFPENLYRMASGRYLQGERSPAGLPSSECSGLWIFVNYISRE